MIRSSEVTHAGAVPIQPEQHLRHHDQGETPYGRRANNFAEREMPYHKVSYRRRKASGWCTAGGCRLKSEVGHTHCRRHLKSMSRAHKERYEARAREALCIYCGKRPGFWGVRCIICRQKFAKNPLPSGARRAIRLYREAEERRDIELAQVDARLAVRKLLATGDVVGAGAKALGLYAGIDHGKWRTYDEVGEMMGISKERVRQLLQPSKVRLGAVLGDRIAWKTVSGETDSREDQVRNHVQLESRSEASGPN